MNAKRVLFTLAALAAMLAGQARAEVALSCVMGEEDGSQDISMSPDLSQSCAQAINVGDGAPAYRLDEVQIRIDTAIDASVLPSMTIVSDGIFNPGTEVIGTLNLTSPLPPQESELNVIYTFSPTSPIILNAQTTYWICISTGQPGDYWWILTKSTPSVAVDNWNFGPTSVSEYGGPWERLSHSDEPFATQVSVTPVPEPSAWVLAGLGLSGLTLLARNRRLA